MKKSISILLIMSLLLSFAFVGCKKNDGKQHSEATAESAEGLENADTEIDFVDVEVTDADGKTVTDKSGEPVTEEVAVVITKDKNGKTVAKVLDKNGNIKKDKNGKEVTVKYNRTTTTKKKKSTTKATTTKKTTSTTVKTTGGEGTTAKEPTTKKGTAVPSTSTSGKAVSFNTNDQQIVKNILEVPYLYQSSYENAQGVPVNIATHAAIWMAEKDGLQPSTFASGTIVLGLFKYFGQTVVNFKSDCNSKGGNDNIQYNSANGTFEVSQFEGKAQTVKITKIEDLGNNYFKVYADATSAGKYHKVVAILQKNKLDIDLGFSLKAVKWME